MSRLSASQYLSAIESESARFREVLADADPGAPVPTCPAWSALDLVNHLADVQSRWAWRGATRPKNQDEMPAREPAPTSYDAAVTAFDQASAGLVAALRDAHPADPAWTWSKEQTVGFILRRQAHEALIHRLDAELTALGHHTDLDAKL